jgi:hypothetical protein
LNALAKYVLFRTNETTDVKNARLAPTGVGCKSPSLRAQSVFNAVVQQDSLDCVPVDLVTEMPKCVPESRIAPDKILSNHTNKQIGDCLLGPRSIGASLLRAVVLLGDEPLVPAENCVRRDDACHLLKHLSSQDLALHGETATVVVVQAEPLTTKLFTKDAVLLHQVVDDLSLVAIHPAGEEKQEEAEGVRW